MSVQPDGIQQHRVLWQGTRVSVDEYERQRQRNGRPAQLVLVPHHRNTRCVVCDLRLEECDDTSRERLLQEFMHLLLPRGETHGGAALGPRAGFNWVAGALLDGFGEDATLRHVYNGLGHPEDWYITFPYHFQMEMRFLIEPTGAQGEGERGTRTPACTVTWVGDLAVSRAYMAARPREAGVLFPFEDSRRLSKFTLVLAPDAMRTTRVFKALLLELLRLLQIARLIDDADQAIIT
jgi:hypothetical protein